MASDEIKENEVMLSDEPENSCEDTPALPLTEGASSQEEIGDSEDLDWLSASDDSSHDWFFGPDYNFSPPSSISSEESVSRRRLYRPILDRWGSYIGERGGELSSDSDSDDLYVIRSNPIDPIQVQNYINAVFQSSMEFYSQINRQRGSTITTSGLNNSATQTPKADDLKIFFTICSGQSQLASIRMIMDAICAQDIFKSQVLPLITDDPDLPDIFRILDHRIQSWRCEDKGIEECCICLEDLNGPEKLPVVKSPCDHLFHEGCCRKWTASHRDADQDNVLNVTCPKCRAPFFPSTWKTSVNILERGFDLLERYGATGLFLKKCGFEGYVSETIKIEDEVWTIQDGEWIKVESSSVSEA